MKQYSKIGLLYFASNVVLFYGTSVTEFHSCEGFTSLYSVLEAILARKK